jgi:starvation-inducible DNA-binding protein
MTAPCEIGISQQDRQEMARHMQLLLANEYVLYTKTLKFHWNVEGKHFGALHAFFKEQYESMLDIVDDVAERIRALGHMSTGTLKEFSQNAIIPEEPGNNPDDLGMIRLLLLGHEEIIRQLRNMAETAITLKDIGTNNFLIDLMEKHEKMAWMLRAHIV